MSFLRGGPPARPSLSASPIGHQYRCPEQAARPFLSAHCFGHAGRVYCPPGHAFLGCPVCRHLRSIPITRYCLTRTLMPALLIGPPDRPSLSVPRRSLPHWPCLPVPHNGPTCHSSVAARLLGPACRPPRSVTNIGAPNRPLGPSCRPIASAMPVVCIVRPAMPSLAVRSVDTSAAFPSPGIVLPELSCLPY